jgi:homocysteine S-methyltransferase
MTANPIQAFLTRQGFAMLDGGLATELENRDADLDNDLWSAKMLIDAPEMIRQVHADFLRAGADIIATSSYQASFEGFHQAGYRHGQAERLMRLSVDLALLARETFWARGENRQQRIRPLVAASIGPYGACLHDGSEYHGNYGLEKDALIDFHRPRMEVLADTGADLFAFETIPSLLEAEALLELIREFPGKHAWLSFSCRDEQHVSHGERFSDCVAHADGSEQIVAVGLNCTAPEYATALLESLGAIHTPLVVYPNSGEHWNPDGNQWTGDGCATLPVLDWYEAGARLVGGCCRTSIDEITRMRNSLTRHVSELRD